MKYHIVSITVFFNKRAFCVSLAILLLGVANKVYLDVVHNCNSFQYLVEIPI